jgi:hypothetical protein
MTHPLIPLLQIFNIWIHTDHRVRAMIGRIILVMSKLVVLHGPRLNALLVSVLLIKRKIKLVWFRARLFLRILILQVL